jgi:hypothetical protein
LLPFQVSLLNLTSLATSPFSRNCDHLPLFRLENGAHHANA